MLNSSTLLEQIAGENKSLKKRLKKADEKIISEIKELEKRVADNYDSSNTYAKDLISALDKKAGELEKVRGLYETAVKQGVKNQNAKKAKPSKQIKKSSTSVQEKLRDIPNETTIEKNIEYVANMEPVAELEGTEFAKGEVDLITQVAAYFESIGGKVNTNYGVVILD